MRLVFTKLETPKKNILVDLGTGTFEEFSLQELEDSETGKYLQIPDTIPANSIRVKVSSSEFENFDMIKEYQITDDEGNILGGNVGTQEITFPLELVNYSDESIRYYSTDIKFPRRITDTGEYVALCASESRGSYFETIVVTRLESVGFRGYPIGSNDEVLFVERTYEENH